MPAAIFQLLSSKIKSRQDFVGYLYNKTFTGNAYWALTTISISISPETNQQCFFSVQRKPVSRSVEAVKSIYADMLDIEKKSSSDDGIEKSLSYLNGQFQSFDLSYETFILSL
jgi:hypothetical protein